MKKKEVPVLGTTLKEILADNIIEESTKSVLTPLAKQTKIVNGDYYALYDSNRERYLIHDKLKEIGYTDCNRFVIYTGVPSSAGKNALNIGLKDMRSILELCQMCNDSLYK